MLMGPSKLMGHLDPLFVILSMMLWFLQISRSEEYLYAMFNKRSTFAIFQEGSSTDVPIPYQVSAGYKISDVDITSIVEIWKCSLADKIEGRGDLAIAPVTTTMHRFSS